MYILVHESVLILYRFAQEMIKDKKQTGVKQANQLNELMKAVNKVSVELVNEISFSAEMLNNGVKTELATQNPDELLVESKNSIDNAAYLFSDHFFNEFFKRSSKFIKRVFLDRSQSSSNYYIVLKEDNQKNREHLYQFLTGYKYSNFGKSYPVLFQILPDSDDLASIKKFEVKF